MQQLFAIAPKLFFGMMRVMELTPRQIRDRAYAARISINKLLGHAGVSNTTLWRWETKGTEPHPVTLGRIEDALAHFEAEKAA